jgi:hypothetical protein
MANEHRILRSITEQRCGNSRRAALEQLCGNSQPAAASSSSVLVLAKTFSQQAGRELSARGGGGVCGGGGEGAGAGAVGGAGSCGYKVRIAVDLPLKAWGRVRKRACGASGLLLLALLSSETKLNLCF